MLTLSRPHRQVLATMAVAVFLVAPTLYVAVMAWRVNQPSHVREVEHEAGVTLGLRVSLTGVRYPSPGVVAFRGVALKPDDAGRKTSKNHAELARAEAIRLRRDGRRLTLEADGLSIRDAQGPEHLLDQLARTLQKLGAGPEWDEVSLLAPTCRLDLGPAIPGYKLKDVAWTYRTDDDSSRLTASYRVVVEDGPAPRCELTLKRARRSDTLHTTLMVRSTDGDPLPARVLAPFFDAEDWLGPHARVDGTLVLHQAGTADWEAEFRGNVDQVDLATVAGRIAPGHRLGGMARIEVESARWADQPGRGPGWVEARGTILSTTRGTIGTALLAALQGQLGFRVADAPDPSPPLQEFQALGLAFAFGPDGTIRLDGALGGSYQPDTVLVHGRSFAPMAFAPEASATVPGLIRTLALHNSARPDLMIPARMESLLIQRYLPAPPVDGGVPPRR